MPNRKPYKLLNIEERYQIKALHESGKKLCEIAIQLKRDASTISREIRRGQREEKGKYIPKLSDQKFQKSRKSSGKTRSSLTPDQWNYVLDALRCNWSPEQLSGRYNTQDKDEKDSCITVSSIYRAIARHRHSKHLRRTYLRHGGKYYNKAIKKKGGIHMIPNRVDISLRPKEADEKKNIGHWEADTVIGAGSSGILVTLVDKASRFTLIAKIANKTADLTSRSIVNLLKEFAKNNKVRSITYDNGGEFAWHERVNKQLNSDSYFAKPYHSWERGLNEHTNGLIREYLPKKASFSDVCDNTITKIQNSLNNRPRKCLNYLTPLEAFA